jgi:hypothetical protein
MRLASPCGVAGRDLGDAQEAVVHLPRDATEGGALDIHVGLSDTDVVKSDIPATGAIAPPRRKGPRSGSPATPLADVCSRSAAELERDLTELLHEARPDCPMTEIAADGSPKVASLVSVWLLSQVGNAVGRPKLVNLSKVRREELRSIGGVDRLVHRTLHQVPVVKAS